MSFPEFPPYPKRTPDGPEWDAVREWMNKTQQALDARFLQSDGSPENVVTANPGAICQDYTSGNVYRKGSGVGTNTGWTAL